MRRIRRTSQFKKDVRRDRKRGKDLGKLKVVIEKLARNEPLEEKNRDHALQGRFRGTRECHVEADWLLIYQLPPEELVLIRTGTHADLFGE